MKRTDNRFCFYSPAIAYVKTFLWLMQYRKGEREEFSKVIYLTCDFPDMLICCP